MTNLLHLVSKYRTELMGISILWIMLFHSRITPPNSLLPRALWYVFISFGGGFGVDLFFILSGFGLMYSFMNNRDHYSWKNYFSKRFRRILPTYFLVAACYYAITTATVAEFFYNLTFLNFIFEGERDFWYIFAIIVFYSLFPLIAKATCRINPLLSVGISAAIMQLICVFCNRFFPTEYSHLEIMLQRFPCFCIGIYMGYLAQTGRKGFLPIVSGCTVAGIMIIILHIQFTGASRWIFTLMSLPVLCAPIGLLCVPYLKITSTMLVWCGKRSLELYLIHVSFGVMLMSCIDDRRLSLVAYFVASLLLTAIVHKLFDSSLFSSRKRQLT